MIDYLDKYGVMFLVKLVIIKQICILPCASIMDISLNFILLHHISHEHEIHIKETVNAVYSVPNTGRDKVSFSIIFGFVF